MTTTPNTRLELGIEHAFGGARRDFSIPAETLLRHGLILGQTGVGKTTFLLNLLAQLTEQGAGIAFLDPHGDAVEELLELISRRRTRDVVYLNPSLTESPVAFNPLGGVPFALRHQRAAAVTESIRALHPNSWGDRLDWILYNSLRALLDTESSTLLDVPRLLVDDHFRSSVTRQIKDPAVRGFWLDEFASYDRQFRTIAVSPVQNKVGKLVAHPPLRAVLGHARAQLSFETVLKRQQLVMANLSGIGAQSANLLGSLYVAAILEEAMSKPAGERYRPFYLVIDEAHRFTTETLATALSEARKYNLAVVLADQFLDQAGETIQRALLGNVGSLFSFRIGARDAARVEKSFGERVTSDELASLDPHQMWLRTLDGKEQVGPLKLTTRPLSARRWGNGANMKRESIRRLSVRQSAREAF